MDEQVKETVVEENTKQVETKKEKTEKVGFVKKVKNFIKRNKKPILAGVTGFFAGAATTVGTSMVMGHRAAKKETEISENYDFTNVSPLDPNQE